MGCLRSVVWQHGAGAGNDLPQNVPFRGKTRVIQARAASDAIVQRNTCHQVCDGGGSRCVADAHFPETDHIGASLRQVVDQVGARAQTLVHLVFQ